MREVFCVVVVILIVVFAKLYKKQKAKTTYTAVIEDFPNDKVLIDLINEYRQSIGLSILKSEIHLTELAREQAYWLELNVKDREEFDVKGHYFLGNRQKRSLIDDTDKNYGEITCYNFVTEKSKLYAYLNSPSHKECIENPNFNCIGSATTNRMNFIIFAKYNLPKE